MEPLPPWIKPADEAAHLAQGYQMGAQIGAQQAAQRFQEMQMARQQELSAQQQARWEAEFGLQKAQQDIAAKEAANKLAAMNQYSQAVQSGTDPLNALVQFGPQMGQNVGSVASAMRLMQAQAQAEAKKPTEVPMPEVQYADVDGQKVPYLVDKKTGRGTWMPSGFSGKSKQQPPGTLTQVDRDELHDLEREQDRLQKLIDKDEDPMSPVAAAMSKDPGKLTPRERAALDAKAKRVKDFADLDAQIKAIRLRARAAAQAGQSAAQPAQPTATYRWDKEAKRIVKVPAASDSGDDGEYEY